ncbi:MAG: penicillin-binding transpeptidase domain-containing protein [Candidatus Komeilibacteria bacterium]
MVKALAESVNTFFYRIGIDEYDGQYGLGLDRMVNYMRAFGLGERTGIDLPGEVTGLVPTREWKWNTQDEVWYPGDTMHLAIGQGNLLVTPLQMANYIAAIANGGTLWAPQIYKEIKDSNTDMVLSSVPTIVRDDIVDPENIDIVREGMRAAVTRGSARLLNTSQYQAAGKTGTAQVGGDKLPHSWFVGFAPFDDPQIAWAVVVENAGESTDAAVPIVKAVLDQYFAE